MKLELVIRTDFSHVQLSKDEKNLIGIKIRDGRKRGAGLFIRKIKPKSLAESCFSIAQRDVLVSVNGQTTAEETYDDVLRMITDAKSCVNLLLQYKIHEIRISQSRVYRKQHVTAKLRKRNGSFGFILRKKDQHCYCSEYPAISVIKEESHVHNNQLQDGDRLIRVDDLNVSWLSLDEIASILQGKDEALFIFEYNIKVVDFPESDGRFDLEIDIPVSDLGLSFGLCADTTMYIDSIRIGSIAERCGAFSVGDIVLSVNEIESKYLTPSKADYLLRGIKKTRKISFIRSRGREINIMTVSNQTENFSIASKEVDMASTESSSGVDTTDWKHVNTPASSNVAFSLRQNYYSQRFFHTEQMKAIGKFQDVLPPMSSLKYHLSRLTHDAFCSRQSPQSENCTFCDQTQHSVKLCTSCLTRMNVKCAESMRLLASMIIQFVNFSSQSVIATEELEKSFYDQQSVKVSVRSIVVALTETLPKAFDHMPELREPFANLAEKIANADKSCSTCEYEIKSVMLIVQKLLLLLSLGDHSVETADLIGTLIASLLDSRFTCDAESEHSCSAAVENEYNISLSDNLENCDDSSSQNIFNNPAYCAEVVSSGTQISSESASDVVLPNTKTKLEYLKIAHIQSVSNSQNTIYETQNTIPESQNIIENDVCENSTESIPHREKEGISSELNNLECSLSSKDPFVKEKKIKGKGLKLPQRVWKSLDSFFRPKRVTKTQTVIQNASQTALNEDSATESREAGHKISLNSEHSSINNRPESTVEETLSDSMDSKRSSLRCAPENEYLTRKQEVRTEKMEMELKNDGDGFGLGIILKYVEETASFIPVVHAIKPNSPSHKSGILKVDDRVVAINHKSTLGLNANELMELRSGAFSAESVSLSIEFDVIDEELKFGTFDVVLDRTLKVGLLFKEMKRGYPMVVSGVAKGSAAHRCGQLYAGDELVFFRCIRCKEYNPISCKYGREEKLHLTVRRDNVQGEEKPPVKVSPYYFNPCFSCEDRVPLNGSDFVVKSTAVRALVDSEALVYDQEVTLFRDSIFWDFGFLLGEDVVTGNAFITDIRPGSPAQKCGAIKKFDRIVKVNGVTVNRSAKNSALALLTQADDKVDLLIRRLYHEGSKSLDQTSSLS